MPALSKSLKTHNKCDYCEQSFPSPQMLHSHFVNIHLTINKLCNQKLKCEYCNKIFTVKEKLVVHIKSHFKTFHCNSCDQIFESWYYCEKHIFDVHEKSNKVQNPEYNLDFNSLDDDSEEITYKPIKTRKTFTDVDEIRKQIENQDILDFFQNKSQSKKLLKFFKRIISGQMSSQRHDLLLKEEVTNFGTNSEIMKTQNITFLKDDGVIDDQLNEIGMKIFDEISYKFDFDTSENNFKSNYSKYVIIPEGIIYFLMKNFNLNYKIAEQIYVTTTAIFEEGLVNSTKTHSSDDTSKIMYKSVPDEINSEDSFDEIPDFDSDSD